MKGIYSALINTFKREDNSPDIEALARIVDYNINVCKVDGLYVNGSTGESFNMPHAHKRETLKAAAKLNAGRISLIAQVGGLVFEETRELALDAAKYGYDAISAVTPFYFKYTPDEIVAYYTGLADFSPLPLVIYNIPVRTGVALSTDDFRKLFGHKNIVGVKFTHNDFFQLETMRRGFPDKVIYSGFDEMLMSAAVLGTDGAIGTTYNIDGMWAGDVLRAVKSGDIAAARAAQTKLNVVVDMLFKTGIIQTTKAVLSELIGYDCGDCRPPMAPNTEATRQNAREIAAYIKSH